jgi:hypothetical protein
MATPLKLPQQSPLTQNLTPRTVLGVQPVTLALVNYIDESAQSVTQLAIIGENTVHLLESRALGFTKNSTPFGRATKWLFDGVKGILGAKN